MEEWVWAGEDLGASGKSSDPRELKDQRDEWRANMIEAAVEMDDDADGSYLEGEEPDMQLCAA